jgi:hypothetical protein
MPQLAAACLGEPIRREVAGSVKHHAFRADTSGIADLVFEGAIRH